MPFDKLPQDALVELFQWLKPGDRLRCTEVCRSWNEVISTTPKLTKDIRRRIHSRSVEQTQENIPRRYQDMVVLLGVGNDNDGVLRYLTKMVQQQWKIEYLQLVGELTPIQRVMQSISFSDLTELKLVILASRLESRSTDNPIQEVVFEKLKRIHCTQCNGAKSLSGTILRLILPNLEQAVFVMEEGENVRHVVNRPLVQMRECSKLKDLEIDMKGKVWQHFFSNGWPLLERLVIRQLKFGPVFQSWSTLFTNAPNLRSLEIVGDSYVCCRVDIGKLNTRVLERLHLENVNLYGPETLQCNKLTELTFRNVFMRSGTLRLFAPDLTRLLIVDCYLSSFIPRVGSQLQSLTIGNVGDGCAKIIDIFHSLENLRELTLHIDTRTLRIIHELGTLPSLRSLKVTYRYSGLRCYLVDDICSNCPAIRELTIEKKSWPSALSPSCYERLRKLGLQLLELHNLYVPSCRE